MNALEDSNFQLPDVVVEGVQELKVLAQAALGLRGKPLQSGFQLGAPLRAKGGVEGQGILGQGGADAVLQHRVVLGEGHPGARQLSLVTEVRRRDPDGGELADREKCLWASQPTV
ncbi:MAG: hypothetical protein A2Z21_01240 [Candidatus Fraserbacteria bacterium RBG_16_55_9]|uniref:Uncharacterized protein n=1 Tax=Fraserbacteria sp. (strain RBG_16_55_9) TaxID=1817864 RepID=A0A1F5UZW7_FRAXR|nr:MAG: hypothetical protein A2Z21_01240 [Candidatus Fraserbacteria bacterium RBG_16_55_9]